MSTRTATLFLSIVLAALAGPGIASAAEWDAALEGHLERIDCYALALADQREALRVSQEKMGGLAEAFNAARDSNDAAEVAACTAEYATLNGLRQFYTQRILDSLSRLAAEHDAAGVLQERAKLYAEVLEHVTAAAACWDESGEIYEAQAADTLALLNYDGAGALQEKAYKAFTAASSKWARALTLVKLIQDGNDVKDLKYRFENSRSAAVNALRAAGAAYFNSYQAHREKAASRKLDIYARKAGDEWRLTALAQQNHERVQRELRNLERN